MHVPLLTPTLDCLQTAGQPQIGASAGDPCAQDLAHGLLHGEPAGNGAAGVAVQR